MKVNSGFSLIPQELKLKGFFSKWIDEGEKKRKRKEKGKKKKKKLVKELLDLPFPLLKEAPSPIDTATSRQPRSGGRSWNGWNERRE
jgi:hypothetical protein